MSFTIKSDDGQKDEEREESVIGAVLVSTNQTSNALIRPVNIEEREMKDCCPKAVCVCKERACTPSVQCSQGYHCRCVVPLWQMPDTPEYIIEGDLKSTRDSTGSNHKQINNVTAANEISQHQTGFLTK